MSTSPVDAIQLLPYGEMLRSFLLQTTLPKGELDTVLRKRGVFARNSDKENTVPYLTSTILSPDEFGVIREAFRTREDKPKTITQMLPWVSEESLLDSIPETIWSGIENDFSFANFVIRKKEDFFPVEGDRDHLRLEFELERHDRSKNWVETQSVHKGAVEIKKIVDAGRVRIAISYTAKETEEVAKKATSRTIAHFRRVGRIDSGQEVERVMFSEFDNANRVQFLLALTADSEYQSLVFADLNDVSISPVSAEEMPLSMSWIEEQVRDMRFRGTKLHTTRLISERDCHSFVEMYNVKAKFQFNAKGSKGQCDASIGFPGRGGKDGEDSQLVIMIDDVKISSKNPETSTAAVKSFLENEFQEKLCEVFASFRARSVANPTDATE